MIRNHLLKVGSCYYVTAQFQADLLRAKKSLQTNLGEESEEDERGFLPISRFGIGLLSCFIVGDRVAVNTNRQDAEGKPCTPVRLSLDGLHGFFTLQDPPLEPDPMPSPDGDETGYRTTSGTSIAIRLNPRQRASVPDECVDQDRLRRSSRDADTSGLCESKSDKHSQVARKLPSATTRTDTRTIVIVPMWTSLESSKPFLNGVARGFRATIVRCAGSHTMALASPRGSQCIAISRQR